MSSRIITTGAVLLLSLLFILGCGDRQGQQGQEGGDTTTVAEAAMQTEEAEEELIQVDCDFATMALDSGLAMAFVRYAADSAIMLRAGQMPIIGHEAIRGAFADGGRALLQWEPQFADVSGDLGYTFGRYQFNPGDTTIGGMRQGTGQTSRGHYVTIWKKIDGQWKYVFDTGAPGPKEMPEQSITKPGEGEEGNGDDGQNGDDANRPENLEQRNK